MPHECSKGHQIVLVGLQESPTETMPKQMRMDPNSGDRRVLHKDCFYASGCERATFTYKDAIIGKL